jgi:hypothetical protein
MIEAYNRISEKVYNVKFPLKNMKISIENPYSPSDEILAELTPHL